MTYTSRQRRRAVCHARVRQPQYEEANSRSASFKRALTPSGVGFARGRSIIFTSSGFIIFVRLFVAVRGFNFELVCNLNKRMRRCAIRLG